jgi:hypothetical protein
MDRVGPQAGGDPLVTEGHGLQGRIIRHHREHRLGFAGGFGRRGADHGTRGAQRFGLVRVTVVDAQRVSGREQVGRHGAAHGAEADEGELHHESPCSCVAKAVLACVSRLEPRTTWMTSATTTFTSNASRPV